MNLTPRAALIKREINELESLEPLLQIEDAINELCKKLAPEMLGPDGKITRKASKLATQHRNILQRLQMEADAEEENKWKSAWRAAEELAKTNPTGSFQWFRESESRVAR